MSKAVVDPDQLRRMAAQLEHSLQELRAQKTNAIAGMAKLHTVWKDEKYSRFEQSFVAGIQQLDRYILATERYVHFLRQKAARAQKFLDNR